MHANPSNSAADAYTPLWQRFLLPSAADLIFLGVLFSLSCSALASRLLGDAGIGWHIRNGELMLRTHAVTHVDPFSSTMGGRAWYAWEWLYDLLIASVHHWVGLNGVVFLTAVVVAATFALTFRIAVARRANLPGAVVLLALAVGASAIHLFARPHVISWLLAVLWFAVLDSWETSPDSLAGSQPVLAATADVVLGQSAWRLRYRLYPVGNLSDERVLSCFAGGDRSSLQESKNLATATLLSLMATFVNPYGYRLHIHILGYLSNHFLMNHIEEFRSPDFHGVAQQCFVILLIIAITALAVAREKPRVSQVLVILFRRRKRPVCGAEFARVISSC